MRLRLSECSAYRVRPALQSLLPFQENAVLSLREWLHSDPLLPLEFLTGLVDLASGRTTSHPRR